MIRLIFEFIGLSIFVYSIYWALLFACALNDACYYQNIGGY